MTVSEAEAVWRVVAIYLGIGALVALFMAARGAAMTDHAARGANLWFRLAILPGAMLFWPIMVLRLLSGRKANEPIEGREP
jgi:hypothetical protein